MLPTLSSAQTWTAEQQEVWKLEEQQWQMSKDKDTSWIDKMVHPNISYWDVDQPGPQNKASLVRWNRYNNANATVLEQELFPISLTITGNVAVVQYRYSVARENYKKERETVTGRYTDVLVKEGALAVHRESFPAPGDAALHKRAIGPPVVASSWPSRVNASPLTRSR